MRRMAAILAGSVALAVVSVEAAPLPLAKANPPEIGATPRG